MKFINPTFTIQNAEGPQWLCSVEHQNDTTMERISVAVLVAKDPALSIAELFEVAISKARADMGRLVLHNARTGQRPPRNPQAS